MSSSARHAGKVDQKRGYLWSVNDGSWDFEADPGARTLEIYQPTAGAVYAVHDLKFSRVGDDLVVEVPEQLHQLRLKGWFGDGHESWRLDKIRYHGGLSSQILHGDPPWVRLSELVSRDRFDRPMQDVDAADVWRQAPSDKGRGSSEARPVRHLEGTASDDTIHGDEKDNTIYTRAGRDRVFAGAGDDRIVVTHRQPDAQAPDNKYINGGLGNDTVDYSSAFVTPTVGITASLKDRVVTWGTSGHDRLVNIEHIVGTVADDRFEGNAKDNRMVGKHGNDRYLVTRGGGNDVILDQDATPDNIDTLVFGSGLRRQDLRARTVGEDVVIEVLAEDGRVDTTVTIERGTRTENAIERLELDDGLRLRWQDLLVDTAVPTSMDKRSLPADVEQADEPAPTFVRGDGRATTYLGTDGKDWIHAGARYDKVLAGAGDDMIVVRHADAAGPSVNKEIRGGRGNDTVDYHGAFGARGGGIYLTLDTQSVTWGQGGEDRLINIENIGGTDDADHFEGDAKNNLMTGRKGNDTYVVTFGGGRDEIVDQDDTEHHRDTLLFGAGIRPDLLLKRVDGPDLVIQVLREDGQYDTQVTIRNGTQSGFAIERFVLADKTEFQLDALKTLPFSVL